MYAKKRENKYKKREKTHHREVKTPIRNGTNGLQTRIFQDGTEPKGGGLVGSNIFLKRSKREKKKKGETEPECPGKHLPPHLPHAD